MTDLVQAAVILRGQVVVLQDGGDGGFRHSLQLLLPVAQPQVTPATGNMSTHNVSITQDGRAGHVYMLFHISHIPMWTATTEADDKIRSAENPETSTIPTVEAVLETHCAITQLLRF